MINPILHTEASPIVPYLEQREAFFTDLIMEFYVKINIKTGIFFIVLRGDYHDFTYRDFG
ncbi:hypothetical protein BACCIP111883_01185 [Sutcliffiella rhizosphaerae]|uniref:Uncharacterized protein n=1 Tax=Sutcliffiella rhizosphaerae TaxID=2880967 RepID=A0ABM8YKF5_9BACI|nr:hypothetical protein BACCIP111883_01185 [Sutcliffiella rhizosphaerae]